MNKNEIGGTDIDYAVNVKMPMQLGPSLPVSVYKGKLK